MPEPIDDLKYWHERLQLAMLQGEPHKAVFLCSAEHWRTIELKHMSILRKHIKPGDKILDAGCGWGRLLDMLPTDWTGGWYVGIDRQPEFINLARAHYPGRVFMTGDLRDLPDIWPTKFFDWGVLVSMRPMVINNLGQEVWEQMHKELSRVCNRLLYLEYNASHDGEVEVL